METDENGDVPAAPHEQNLEDKLESTLSIIEAKDHAITTTMESRNCQFSQVEAVNENETEPCSLESELLPVSAEAEGPYYWRYELTANRLPPCVAVTEETEFSKCFLKGCKW